jgi:hypothetical protein
MGMPMRVRMSPRKTALKASPTKFTVRTPTAIFLPHSAPRANPKAASPQAAPTAAMSTIAQWPSSSNCVRASGRSRQIDSKTLPGNARASITRLQINAPAAKKITRSLMPKGKRFCSTASGYQKVGTASSAPVNNRRPSARGRSGILNEPSPERLRGLIAKPDGLGSPAVTKCHEHNQDRLHP